MKAVGKNILLCTLGASWAVIPEIFGWLAPEKLDLYANHPQLSILNGLRSQHNLLPPDELWICTTEGAQTQKSLDLLTAWWQIVGCPLPLRIWSAQNTNQLATQAECDHIRELTLRVVMLATEQLGSTGQLILSLAGGRKTMSADLQSAGTFFGAHACLHVVGPEPMPEELRQAVPYTFTKALSSHVAAAITPLVAGTGVRNELLDIVLEGKTISSRQFPLPLALANQPCSWCLPSSLSGQEQGTSLYTELAQRQKASSQLMGNFLAQIAQSEQYENWRSLYRLSPARIAELRTTQLAPQHLPWLIQIPKADLHRHIGGCLNIAQQQQVARVIWDSLDARTQQLRINDVAPLLAQTEWPWDWPSQLKSAGDNRPLLSAALLLYASQNQLQHNLFAVTEPRSGLRNTQAGFAAYERPGELSGSALLSHSAAIASYAQAIVDQARAEGLVYLELRGSPHKYRPEDPAGFLHDLRSALETAGACVTSPGMGPRSQPVLEKTALLRISFIWILDRRQHVDLPHIVQVASTAFAQMNGFLVGLDLAGDEGTSPPLNLTHGFSPAFENCIALTIHAGEGESAEKIWQAAYHLHADRIGHGLTLAENPQLMDRFRNRGICLELCPSSNREVVGYKDSADPQSANLPTYPLRTFLTHGLPLTLCTDNPGISRTTLANEYLAAARMSNNGLTLWEVLALIRQAFIYSFLPSLERDRLQKQVDTQVFNLLSQSEILPTSLPTKPPQQTPPTIAP